MKMMKKLMLAIAFMVFGIVSANAEISLKEITLSGVEDKVYYLSTSPANPIIDFTKGYNKANGGFLFESVVPFKCTGSDENVYDYVLTPSGKINQLCTSGTAEEENKEVSRLVEKDGSIIKATYKKEDSDGNPVGEPSTNTLLEKKADSYSFSLEEVGAKLLYSNEKVYLYKMKKSITNASGTSYVYAIYDAKGNALVDFGGVVDQSTSDVTFSNAVAIPNGPKSFKVVSGNGQVKGLDINNFTKNLKENEEIEKITVYASSKTVNYYVAKIKSKTEYIIMYDIDGGLGIVKDTSGSVRRFSNVPVLKNINGTIAYEKNGIYFKLDGTSFTSTEENTEFPENKFMYTYNNTSVGFKSGKEELVKTKAELGISNLNLKYIGTTNDKYYFVTTIGSVAIPATTKMKLFELTIDNTYNPDDEPVNECKIDGTTYYGKDGNKVSKEEYEKQCSPELPKYSCEEKDGKYYDKDGKEVSKDEFTKSCSTNSNNGTGNNGSNGNSTTVTKCEVKDGKYYGPNGDVIDKATYESVCGLSNNPHTGIALPIILVIALSGIGFLVYKTKGKDLFKKI